MSQQLDTAYDLIKQGRVQDALSIVEPIIRSDRDDEDAWWLYANAISDTSARRNAINNVLRLTSNDSRREKAQALLEELDDDPYDFDIAVPQKSTMSAYEAIDEAPKKQRGSMNCATLTLILVGLVGVCAIGFGVIAFMSAGGIMQALTYPDNYVDMGMLENNLIVEETLSDNEPTDGYHYTGANGDTISMTVDYESLGSPLIVVFQEGNEVPLTFANPETSGIVSLVYTLPTDGDYLITINGFEFIGTNFGFGNYTLEIEIEQ